MDSSLTALRRLLAAELPLEAIGPDQRDAVRRALRAGDGARLKAVARAAVGELLRSGRLLRVAVEAAPGPASGPFVLVPGANRLIDLACLGDDAPWATGPLPQPPSPAVPANVPGIDDVAGLLGAMEYAQDLETADLRASDKGSILAGALRLVGRFVPQFDLNLQLPSGETAPDDADRVFTLDSAARAAGWQSLRPAGHSVWIPSLNELPDVVRRRHEQRRGAPADCGVAVPLWEPSRASDVCESPVEAGLLYLSATGEWGREPLLRLAERLSRFVTRRWQSQREVNLRIHRDGLTGVFNRAYFDSQFPLELERARRSQGPLTLVLADLDHFKAVNDRYGHPAGDRVLRMMARRLQEALRRIDHVCRVGGEEFALILTDTPAEAAHEVVSRLLDADYTEIVDEDGQRLHLRVTFSAGAVTFPGAGLDPFELYRKADAMLYLSKDLGRDQCHFWDNDGQHLRLAPRPR
ncbi:MAG: GGDEF domain-containing protein [bacterium]|nr:GGDEF domain-containing protein [bacterium]